MFVPGTKKLEGKGSGGRALLVRNSRRQSKITKTVEGGKKERNYWSSKKNPHES